MKSQDGKYKPFSKSEWKNIIPPVLVVAGSAYILIALPELISYNSSFFNLLDDALPHTIFSTVLVWAGFSFHKVKNFGFRIILTIFTSATTFAFIYNIAGIIWYSMKY